MVTTATTKDQRESKEPNNALLPRNGSRVAGRLQLFSAAPIRSASITHQVVWGRQRGFWLQLRWRLFPRRRVLPTNRSLDHGPRLSVAHDSIVTGNHTSQILPEERLDPFSCVESKLTGVFPAHQQKEPTTSYVVLACCCGIYKRAPSWPFVHCLDQDDDIITSCKPPLCVC